MPFFKEYFVDSLAVPISLLYYMIGKFIAVVILYDLYISNFRPACEYYNILLPEFQNIENLCNHSILDTNH